MDEVNVEKIAYKQMKCRKKNTASHMHGCAVLVHGSFESRGVYGLYVFMLLYPFAAVVARAVRGVYSGQSRVALTTDRCSDLYPLYNFYPSFYFLYAR